MTERRVLEVTDPTTLRALAHPVRTRLLRLVRERGPVTGAELAQVTGESTASVSYHLSMLARHGFIEPDPAPGATRRHKPWRATFDALRIVSDTGLAPADSPEGAVLAGLLREHRDRQDDFVTGRSDIEPEWRDTATFQLTRLTLSADEVDRLSGEIEAVLATYRHRAEDGPSALRHTVDVSFIAVPTPADGGTA